MENEIWKVKERTMSIEKEVVRKDDKLYVQATKGKGEPVMKEIVLRTKDFKGEPEQVKVGVGVTVVPKQFESIRIDYSCTVHHDAGAAMRDQAFDVAKFHCMERLVDDVTDLHSAGIIKDHFLSRSE